jgi:hypothetical protein
MTDVGAFMARSTEVSGDGNAKPHHPPLLKPMRTDRMAGTFFAALNFLESMID